MNQPLSFTAPSTIAALDQLAPSFRAARDALVGVCTAFGVSHDDLPRETGEPLGDFAATLAGVTLLASAIIMRIEAERARLENDAEGRPLH